MGENKQKVLHVFTLTYIGSIILSLAGEFRIQKLIWPDRRWRSDLICSSKFIKSDRRSEKPRQLIRSDQLLQLPRGHSDGHWLRPVYIHYFAFWFICKLLHTMTLSCVT